jgi:FkbM family methyltransferase
MLTQLKRALAATFPTTAGLYRELRARRHCSPAALHETPHGFRLAGSETMASAAFEPAETRFVRERVRGVGVFADVGANIGFFTCLARHAGAQVLAVEPSRDNLECLLFNLRANGWDDVEVLPVGLSDRIGIASLHGAGTGASLVTNWGGAVQGWDRNIPLSTLDAILAHRFGGEKLLIKVDVEGSELGVLRGAAQTLSRRPSPTWLVEVCLTENHPAGINPDFASVFETFWSHGYESRALLEDGGERSVTPQHVARWTADRRREFGYVSYVFERAP